MLVKRFFDAKSQEVVLGRGYFGVSGVGDLGGFLRKRAETTNKRKIANRTTFLGRKTSALGPFVKIKRVGVLTPFCFGKLNRQPLVI